MRAKLSSGIYIAILFAVFGLGPVGALGAGIGSGPSSPYDATAIHKTAPNQTITGNLGLTGNLDVKGYILNSGAGSGGSVAFNDPIRNLSTTTALFESSTAATAGTDTAFKANSLVSLAGTDVLFSFANNGAENTQVLASGAINATAFRAYGTTALTMQSAQELKIVATLTDGATAVGTVIDSPAYTTAGAKLLSVRNNTVEQASVDKDGLITSNMAVYGELYDYESPTALALTTQGTYYQIRDTVVGENNGTTPSAATDNITTTYAGTYVVSASIAGTIDAAGQVVEMKVYYDGAGKDNCAVSAKFLNTTDEQAMAITCIVTAAAAKAFDVRLANTTSASDSFSPTHFSLTVHRLN